MKISDYLGGQIVKFNIRKVKKEVFRNTDPKAVALRMQLFPDGEPTTDEFVIRLAEYVKEEMKK